MSEEKLKAFLEKFTSDASLQEKLKAAANSDGVCAIAKEAGFSISADDLKNAQQSELSNAELERAAGVGDSLKSDSVACFSVYCCPDTLSDL
ncbi:nif11-like leader peptide domain protein [Synechococcus sp. BIOS-E4-1]|uniref:Nif11-like leader peptide family natural product precursor n=1 Tax=Synechococcus sp. BIOS-E4-1 TaxID=1400864 RepID=UPI0016494061|nr:Nif11-like leader peptide family natural product precursor [Synechococcus sp. BIOS-E4-1]QNI54662.1 nif11-like leader peptide domain protein [Synechococcus sp. BIOS-E4-1]